MAKDKDPVQQARDAVTEAARQVNFDNPSATEGYQQELKNLGRELGTDHKKGK